MEMHPCCFPPDKDNPIHKTFPRRVFFLSNKPMITPREEDKAKKKKKKGKKGKKITKSQNHTTK
jgi:hypothetical protein